MENEVNQRLERVSESINEKKAKLSKLKNLIQANECKIKDLENELKKTQVPDTELNITREAAISQDYYFRNDLLKNEIDVIEK